MSAYDIERQTLDLLDELAENGGDLDAFDAEISALLGEGEEAVRRAWHAYHRLADEAVHHKATAAHYTATARSAGNAADRVRDIIGRLLAARELVGEEPKVQGLASLSMRTSMVLADDVTPESLPEQYRRVRVDLDTAAIRAALDAGQDVPGARLTTTPSVRIQRRK